MATATLPRRSEIALEYTWNLESMYGDNSLWEKDFELVGERLPGLEAYKDHLGDSPKTLLGALKMQDELGVKLEQLIVYANMRKDEDNTNPEYQALTDRHLLGLVMRHTGGNLSQASRLLGITRATLRAKLAALGMRVDRPATGRTARPAPRENGTGIARRRSSESTPL